MNRLDISASRALLVVEVAAVAAIFVADWAGHIVLSKTPYLLALAIASLWLRGVRWRDVGLAPGARPFRLAAVGVAAGVAMSALELLVTQPALVALTGREPDLSDVAGVRGDLAMFALFLALVWTLAAVGEELVWRGWLMPRIANALGGGRGAWALSLLGLALAFGLAHFPQGPTGVIENMIAGLLLGGLYLATGRNLVAPIVAHGVQDTVDVSLIFAGLYPGLQA